MGDTRGRGRSRGRSRGRGTSTNSKDLKHSKNYTGVSCFKCLKYLVGCATHGVSKTFETFKTCNTFKTFKGLQTWHRRHPGIRHRLHPLGKPSPRPASAAAQSAHPTIHPSSRHVFQTSKVANTPKRFKAFEILLKWASPAPNRPMSQQTFETCKKHRSSLQYFESFKCILGWAVRIANHQAGI